MTANITLLAVVGVLVAAGVYLLLERSIIKMLLGLLLAGNGINLLLLTLGGPAGHAPIVGVESDVEPDMADPLAQAMILTAIVITMGVAAFVLALTYRSYTYRARDEIENDPEDTLVSQRRSLADLPSRDRSDDPLTGIPSKSGDAFDAAGNPIPLDQLKNIEDLEAYEDLHDGDFDDPTDSAYTQNQGGTDEPVVPRTPTRPSVPVRSTRPSVRTIPTPRPPTLPRASGPETTRRTGRRIADEPERREPRSPPRPHPVARRSRDPDRRPPSARSAVDHRLRAGRLARRVCGAAVLRRRRRHRGTADRWVGGADRHLAGRRPIVGVDAGRLGDRAAVGDAVRGRSGIHDGNEQQPVSIFLPTYLALTAGVNIAFLAGDLFNLFVGFEVLLAASFVLLTLGASADRVRAGVSYVMVSMVSSLVFLVGIAFAYAATGTLNLAQMALRMDEISPGTRAAIFGVLLVAFGIKAAVFPLSSWLPDSYPTAPAPVTAVFAGLLTKVGVYAIIRAHTLLFPGGELDDVLLVAGLLTMIIGILGAIAQNDIKRLLSFTLVSHIGYMIFGVALSSQTGLAGAVYYVGHHILVQTTLFLVVGLIERQAGSASLRRSAASRSCPPLLAVLFLIPALNLGGIPPFSGSSARSPCCRPARRTVRSSPGSSSPVVS